MVEKARVDSGTVPEGAAISTRRNGLVRSSRQGQEYGDHPLCLKRGGWAAGGNLQR